MAEDKRTGEEIDLNDEEEAALDAAWESLSDANRFVSEPGDLIITKQVPKESGDGTGA